MEARQGNIAPHGRMAEAGAHLVLYDGECGLCDRLIQFLLSHDRRRVFRFAPLQGSTGRTMVRSAGRDPDEMTTFYVVADYQTPRSRLLTRSRAALFALEALGQPWSYLKVLRMLPRPFLDRAYDLVARHRYRWFGRRDACLLPDAEARDRFLD
jgi:predicted DCC family thiol-disulfide oxidoreductase YuxK